MKVLFGYLCQYNPLLIYFFDSIYFFLPSVKMNPNYLSPELGLTAF